MQAQAAACEGFDAIAQASLPYDLLHEAPWGGPLSGWLDGVPLFGRFFGNDGATIFRQHMGMGKGGVYTFCAGNDSCGNSFTWEVPNAVFIGGPGAIGAYIGNTAKVVSGTGTFEGASGNLNVNGPASTWPSADSPIGVNGAWNVRLSERSAAFNKIVAKAPKPGSTGHAIVGRLRRWGGSRRRGEGHYPQFCSGNHP